MSSLAQTNKYTWLKLSKFLYPSDSRHIHTATVNDTTETHMLSVNTKKKKNHKPAPPPPPASTRSGMLTTTLLESCAVLSVNCTVFRGYDPFKAVLSTPQLPNKTYSFLGFHEHTLFMLMITVP